MSNPITENNKRDYTNNDESINENMANLSLKSNQKLSFTSPGPAIPTVVHTPHVLTPQEELNNQLALNNEPSNNNENIPPSVNALKMTLSKTENDIINSTHEHKSINKKAVHPYQYQYFSDNKQNNVNDVDPDDGILQSEDKLINQTMLQNAIKRDMKRKRNDSMTQSNILAPLTNATDNQKQPEQTVTKNITSKPKTVSTTTSTRPPISATAAMMMRLYGDKRQQEKENEPKEVSVTDSQKNGTNIKPTGSTVKLPDNKKMKKPASLYKNEVKPHYSDDNSSFSSFSDFENENTEVILRWRDKFADIEKSKISIISKDIVDTLTSLDENYEISEKNKKEHYLAMEYEPATKEWFVPNLYLPPGIYKLQFLVNNVITHSNYLPTATNSVGNIVNWFEVLPGYETIEPYRDEDRRQVNPQSKEKTLSTTSLTDYAGISRCNSVVSRSSSIISKSSMLSMKITHLNSLTNLTEPKKAPIYTNEIPELFKFDTDSDSMIDDSNETFDLNLSKVVDSNQDQLFANMQRVAKMNTEEAEVFFLNKFKVPDLPIYLNSTYLNKNFNNDVNHIIPHVNLNHLLTSSIKEDTICVGCTTRYEGKFITQVMYAPCNYDTV